MPDDQADDSFCIGVEVVCFGVDQCPRLTTLEDTEPETGIIVWQGIAVSRPYHSLVVESISRLR